ncbi:MAG: hypothetical protein Q4E59_07765 [Bacteroidales bacterium]|nr:hypothetical protein [Bacteroidales bacterium]
MQTKRILLGLALLACCTTAALAQVTANDSISGPPQGPPPGGFGGGPGDPPPGPPPGGFGGGPGGGGPGNHLQEGAASPTGYSQTEGTNAVEGKTYTSTNSDENAVQVKGGTFTMTNCTIEKFEGNTQDSDGSSFCGTNSAVYAAGEGTVINMKGGTIKSKVSGVNGIMAYNSGTINVSDVTITSESSLSRGLHATGGGIINAKNLNITTQGTSCSVIATDRGGGTVTVEGGNYTTSGYNSAVAYSTGNITVTGATGLSTQGEAGVIEGSNFLTFNDCNLTSGSSLRGIMILQSGSGDAEGFEGVVDVNRGKLTLTGENTPLVEVPTNTTGTVTLKDVELTVPSGVLMVVNYNKQWQTKGGTGNLILATDKKAATYEGDVKADEYSTATVKVNANVTWKGAFDNANAAKSTSATICGMWVLTADSHVDSIVIEKGGKIDKNGFNLDCNSIQDNN